MQPRLCEGRHFRNLWMKPRSRYAIQLLALAHEELQHRSIRMDSKLLAEELGFRPNEIERSAFRKPHWRLRDMRMPIALKGSVEDSVAEIVSRPPLRPAIEESVVVAAGAGKRPESQSRQTRPVDFTRESLGGGAREFSDRAF